MTTLPHWRELSEADLDFVVQESTPDASDSERLKRLILENEEFREALVGHEKVFQRVMDDDEVFLNVSPALYFEVLLRRTSKDLRDATHTIERTGQDTVAVFDTHEVVDLLSKPGVLEYLSGMLASFTRVESFSVPLRVSRGIRRRLRYSDMDVDSLMRLCSETEEADRLRYYKRIADVCLFVSGVFPRHAYGQGATAVKDRGRLSVGMRRRRSIEDYEREGRRFYGLAEEHPGARAMQLSGIFRVLSEYFASARKPLTFIASHYLHSRSRSLFGLDPG